MNDKQAERSDYHLCLISGDASKASAEFEYSGEFGFKAL
jgi:hypothetical protein